ncbi:hypothetical protein CAC42_4704 [Sphaceloma murrayae]|uniref:Uncharacterized protein n=1 Tax=Sphaceloma murrayae TaxID=2082308 RepID=A0A2K1QP98_9PEZI|nr:hypothetical protein CAC42_4704 [Sphaceloma murrayae]
MQRPKGPTRSLCIFQNLFHPRDHYTVNFPGGVCAVCQINMDEATIKRFLARINAPKR